MPRPSLPLPPITEKDVARFWSKVHKRGPDDCWEWGAGKFPFGHGQFSLGGTDGRGVVAHRVAWRIAHGEDPLGQIIRHACDNPPCVNPAHLLNGTQHDNVEDMVRRNRQARGERVHTNRLTADQVLEIRRRYAEGDASQTALAAEYGVAQTNIGAIVRRLTWKHL